MIQPLWKKVAVSQKSKQVSTLQLSNSTPKDYPREIKRNVYKNNHMAMFIAALLIILPNWTQPRCPLPRKDNQIVAYSYNKIVFSNTKEYTTIRGISKHYVNQKKGDMKEYILYNSFI